MQTHEDLLLAVNAPSVWTMQEFQTEKSYFSGSPADKLKDQSRFTAGIRVYDTSKPEKPKEIGFMPTDGLGPHRIWYVGGRYANSSIYFADFTDHIFAVIDMSDPTKPEVVGRFWLPGMWRAGGETLTWREGKRYACHHGLVTGNIAYAAWRDGGLSVLDIADPAEPKMLAYRNMDSPSAAAPITASAAGPQPARPWRGADLRQLQRRAALYLDVRRTRTEQPGQHRDLSAQPSDTDYCAKGGSFGPHNLHENRPGSLQSSRLIFATYYNAGVRAYDVADLFRPREIAYYVPANPTRMLDPRPNWPRVIQSCDCYVDPNGLMYLTDPNAGLNILQFEGI